jgi:pSer/pThr/pTyr-binding forkhead associated (FHA) protein
LVKFFEFEIRVEIRTTRCMADTSERWLEAVLVPRGQKHLAVHQTFALDAQRVWVFGSDPQRAHIVLDCPCVDARHAELVREEAEEGDGSAAWELVDYGGDNGTFLNGERVSRARVSRYVQGGALSFSSHMQHPHSSLLRVCSHDSISFGLGRNVRHGGSIPPVAVRASFRGIKF